VIQIFRDGFVWVSKTVNGPCKSKTSVRKVPYLGHFAQLPLTYKPLQKCANKQGVTVHSFRRTYAYLLEDSRGSRDNRPKTSGTFRSPYDIEGLYIGSGLRNRCGRCDSGVEGWNLMLGCL
jgi:hypothetical protein